MPTTPPNIAQALVSGGVPQGVSVAGLQWLVVRHSALAVASTDARRLWHARWAFTCQDLLASVPFAPPGGARRLAP